MLLRMTGTAPLGAIEGQSENSRWKDITKHVEKLIKLVKKFLGIFNKTIYKIL